MILRFFCFEKKKGRLDFKWSKNCFLWNSSVDLSFLSFLIRVNLLPPILGAIRRKKTNIISFIVTMLKVSGLSPWQTIFILKKFTKIKFNAMQVSPPPRYNFSLNITATLRLKRRKSTKSVVIFKKYMNVPQHCKIISRHYFCSD
jgi:hypothetical protein